MPRSRLFRSLARLQAQLSQMRLRIHTRNVLPTQLFRLPAKNKLTNKLTMKRIIIPSKLHALMSGAVQCNKGKRKTDLIYTDGTKDTVKTDSIPASTNWENWFSIVGAIQSLRK